MDITTYALLKKSIDGVMDEVDTKTAEAAEAWLEDNIDPESGYALDRTLSLESAAAPADLTGYAWSHLFSDVQHDPVLVSSGYRMNESDGKCSKNSSYQVNKYQVTAGERVKVVSDDRFQFQNSPSVPSTGTSNRVGDTTYQNGTFELVVPQGATWLVASTPVNGSTAAVYYVESGIAKNRQEIDAIEKNDLFTYSDYGADYITAPASGFTYTKTGPINIIDGERTGTTSVGVSLTTDTLVSINNSSQNQSFTNPKMKLKAGRKYLARVKILSGSMTSTDTGVRAHEIRFIMYDGVSTPSREDLVYIRLTGGQSISAANIAPVSRIIEPTADVQCGFVWFCRGKVTLDAFTILVDIEDVTEFEMNPTVYSGIVERNQEAVDRIRASNWWWGAKAERPTMVNLLHFSDIHGWKAELERVIRMKNYLKEQGLLTDAICTGDLVTASYGGGDYENVWCATPGTSDILFAIGNHDTYQQSSSPHGTLTAAQKYANYFSGKTSGWGIEMNADTSYYYKDYEDAGVRLIVADTAVVDSDSDQKTWLENTLAGAAGLGYAVIVAAHYLRLNSTTEIQSATIIDNAWSNPRARAAGTDEMTYDWAGTDIVKCVTDFIADGGEFICYLIGHTHSDIIGYPTGHPDQLIITLCSAAVGEATAANRDNTGGDLPRQTGTKTEDCFNVITVEPTSKLLKCVRVGADVNMLQTPRKAFVWDYDNKEFVSVM